VALALCVTCVGGIVLGISYVVSLPLLVVLAGTGLFALGALAAGVAAVYESRQEGKTLVSALVTGVRTAFRWALTFFP
jgi:hypothetical protein